MFKSLEIDANFSFPHATHLIGWNNLSKDVCSKIWALYKIVSKILNVKLTQLFVYLNDENSLICKFVEFKYSPL